MSSIWKFPLVPGRASLVMPIGAKVLSVQTQQDLPHLWAMVDPTAPTTTRTFVVHPTGSEFDPTGLIFVGTFLMRGDRLVFHVFEAI